MGFLRFRDHRIAYATAGSGPAIVLPAWWVSNVAEDWREERIRRFLGPLAARGLLVRYDRLGCGMSDRSRPQSTLSVDFEVQTLHALIEHLGLERVTLLGGSWGGCTAVVYATQHPEHVARVVLYGTYANGAALVPEHVRDVTINLVRAHWGLGSRVLADAFVPSGDAAARDAFAAFQRRSATADMAADLLEMMFSTDVREEAAALRAPTLVVHRRGDRAIPAAGGEQLAALIPTSELVLLDGDAHLPWDGGGGDDVLAAIAPFLGLEQPREGTSAATPRRLTAREQEVLRLVAEELSDADIAQRLVLSPHTVHRHVANILRKLGLHSRAAAAAHAARAGLV
jgi:pimeloyl-ACP methyl ester carboxylesterase/DNA-binding CsgD family transcriptional regulator